MESIFDLYSNEEIDEKLEYFIELIKEKVKEKEIRNNVDIDGLDEFLTIAYARALAEKEFGKDISARYFNSDDLRFGTPVNVADYRANKLKCKIIVDLCCGVGMQSFAFSKTCSQVYGIEIDSRKVKYASENFNLKNIHFIQGDVLSEEIINKIKEIKPDVIFCDPERLASEKERKLDSIKPNIKQLLDVYSKITPKICIEIPPQIEFSKLKELEEYGCFEIEYLSVKNRLNRVNIYFNELKENSISAVDVDSGEKIYNKENIAFAETKKNVLKYIYDISSAVAKAGLRNEAADMLDAFVFESLDKNRLLLTSDKLSDKLLGLSKRFEVLYVADNVDDACRKLYQYGFGKVVLRGNVNPEDYWKQRNRFEKNLRGNKKSDLFFAEDKKGRKKYIICREIDKI